MDVSIGISKLPEINSGTQFENAKSRTWVEINKSAVMHNLNQFKSIVGPETQLAVIAKSNAYGHGLLAMAQICQESSDANWLCVFSLTEALIVRQNGFTKPILVLGHMDADLYLGVMHSVDMVAYDLDFIAQLNEIAKKLNTQAFVHIKIDTGLSRLGVCSTDALELIKNALKYTHVTIRGIFSHFSESDARDQVFTRKQLQRFNNLFSELKKLNISIQYIHSSNTSGIIRFDSCHFNFVRTGGGSYGLFKSVAIDQLGQRKHCINLKLAISWKSRIMQIKNLAVGTYVSYARTFVTARPTRVAIIPIGYWDGYNRNLSNKGMVYIHGVAAPVIGRVCMNMVIIDITDIQNVVVGDEVLLIGDKPGITPDDIALATGTINYEVTTRINPSISRIII